MSVCETTAGKITYQTAQQIVFPFSFLVPSSSIPPPTFCKQHFTPSWTNFACRFLHFSSLRRLSRATMRYWEKKELKKRTKNVFKIPFRSLIHILRIAGNFTWMPKASALSWNENHYYTEKRWKKFSHLWDLGPEWGRMAIFLVISFSDTQSIEHEKWAKNSFEYSRARLRTLRKSTSSIHDWKLKFTKFRVKAFSSLHASQL